MDYEEQLRMMFLRYPADDAKVFIDPSISNLEIGMLKDFNTQMTEVSNPDEATCIPLWVGYSNHLSDSVMQNYVNKYPEKCLSVVNFIDQLEMNNEECDEETFEQIKKMLESTDWESIYLGLNMLKVYTLTDEQRNIVKMVVDTTRNDRMSNSASLIPLPNEQTAQLDQESRRISIGDISIIKYYYLKLHNKFFE